MADHHISNDEELQDRVRSTTFYENIPKEVPTPDLENQIRNAKLRLDDEAGVTDFYADTGIQRAMLYATCVEAKCAIENYSVTSWDVGEGDIDVSGAGDEEQLQFQRWAEDVSKGLGNSDEATVSNPTNIVSNSWVG